MLDVSGSKPTPSPTIDPDGPLASSLDGWPYVTGYLLDTMDAELIETHAVAILSRALNIGRVVAFVGAGASMSYGRLSWRDLVNSEKDRAKESYLKYKRLIGDTNVEAHIQKLYDTLQEITRHRSIRPENYPILFQISEQLDDVITKAYQARRLDPGDGDSQPRQSTRADAQRYLIDDRGHAQLLLTVPTRAPPGGKDDDTAKKCARLVKQWAFDNRDSDAATVFTPEFLNEVADAATEEDSRTIMEGATVDFQSLVKKHFSLKDAGGSSGLPPKALLPIDRYLVSAALFLLPREQTVRLVSKKMKEVLPSTGAGKPSSGEQTKRRRHDKVPLRRDPLRILNERLHIQRFITTNYDHEIDRLFEDLDYQVLVSGEKKPQKEAPADAPNARVTRFDRGETGAMMAFASQDKSRSAAVVHLHGRATPEGDGHIIVTERNYQDLYAALDETRDLVDAAIRTAFAANPVVFVGSNVGEDDIMRPMRQFMGTTGGRIGDRIAIAVLPRTKDSAETKEQKIALLGRHGVYSIHFGLASFESDTKDDLSSPTDQLNRRLQRSYMWLPVFSQLIVDLKESIKQVVAIEFENKNQYNEAVRKTIMELRGTVKPRQDHLEKYTMERMSPGGPVQLFTVEDEEMTIRAPTQLEAIDVGSGRSDREYPSIAVECAIVSFVVNQLDQLVKSLREKDVDLNDDELPSLHRLVVALDVLLQGANDGVLAAFTCARLLRAQWEWDNWKTNWYEAPRPREVRRRELENVVVAPCVDEDRRPVPIVLSRHVMHLPDEPDGDPLVTRFYRKASSQNLTSLLGALGGNRAARFRNLRSRRVLLLVGDRGVGKGHLVSVLRGPQKPGGPFPKELRKLLEQLSPDRTSEPLARWAACLFLNLSFTHDVMSQFDLMIDTLEATLKIAISSGPQESCSDRFVQLNRLNNTVQKDRLGRLELLLRLHHEWAHDQYEEIDRPAWRRTLVFVNAAGMLFDTAGAAKNGQLKILFDLLFSEKFSRAAIDIVLVVDPARVPAQFRIGDAFAKRLMPILVESERVSERIRRRSFELYETSLGHSPSLDDNESDPSTAVHVLRSARVSTIMAAFFPRVAVLLAWRKLYESDLLGPGAEVYHAFSHKVENNAQSAQAFRQAIASVLKVLLPHTGMKQDIDTTRILNQGIVGAALYLDFGGKPECFIAAYADNLKNGLETCSDAIDILRLALRGMKDDAAKKKFDLALKSGDTVGRLKKAIEAYDSVCKEIFGFLGRGRYATTLFLSAMQETSARLTWEPPVKRNKLSRDVMVEVTSRIMRKTNVFDLRLRSATPARRFEIIVDEYLQLLKRHHDERKFLPSELTFDFRSVPGFATGKLLTMRKATIAQFDVMTQVIHHLALVGQPVYPEVLLACRPVSAAVERLIDDIPPARKHFKTAEEDKRVKMRRIVLDGILALSVQRGLVFEVEPAGDADAPSGAPTPPNGRRFQDSCRFVVHSLIQRTVFKRIGGSDVESHDADQFTVSLHASQPADLPTLTADAHHEIIETLEELAGYPDMTGRLKRLEDAPEEYVARRLRAAMGIMRSIYSVGVLSRFEGKVGDGEASRTDVGSFERYRRLLRWVILQAVRLDKSYAKKKDGARQQYVPPFYAEEIVWLYNECGVLSLVQGRLSDARALLDQALFFTRKHLEQSEFGPLTIRIRLNMAMVDIERGQADQARQYLLPISELKATEEHAVPPLIAKGYLALIRHIDGDFEGAEKEYRQVVEELRGFGRLRTVSIFARHLADLLRAREKYEDAKELAEEAVRMARQGGHEDIRQQAELSRLKVDIAKGRRDEYKEVHARLDQVERYAQFVGMSRLVAEVCAERARLLYKQGESRLAVTLAAQSLEIAAINDMKLRKIRAMKLMADILGGRNAKLAEPLRQLAIKMSRGAHYRSAMEEHKGIDQPTG